MKSVLDGIKKDLSPEEQKLFLKRGFAGKLISQARNSGKTIASTLEAYYSRLAEYTELLQRLADQYEQRKKDTNSFDFDDLLVKWLELFVDYDEVKNRYQKQFHHVLVDEFQDTNIIQGRIIDLLAEKSKVCVVGDDAQSIYAFRFAEIDNIIRFPSRHPDCQVIRMEENYRSTPQIVDLINEVISINKDQFPKRLVSQIAGGEKPWVIKARDVYEEAAFVAQRIQELYHQGLRLNKMAVLYRSSYLSQDLELEIIRRQIPYRTCLLYTSKYGAEKVAQVITFGTMAARSAVRDVGRALDIKFSEVDRIAKLIPFEAKMTIERALAESKDLQAYYEKEEYRKLIDISRALEGLPRHASKHAAGVVISRKPLINYVPLQKMTKDGSVVTQFPMETLEKMGLLKMDFLGLKTLNVIGNTLQYINAVSYTHLDVYKRQSNTYFW